MSAAAGDHALRSDARRNREVLLEVARTVLAEEGADASLRDIARRAGVGIGTLYRHFPTREALLEAVLRDRLVSLGAAAGDAAAGDAPGAALVAWLRRLVAGSATYRGLSAAMVAALDDPGSELHAACSVVHQNAADLLRRAQETGEIREDVNAMDLFDMAAAIGWLGDHVGPERAARLLDVLSSGLENDEAG